MFDHCQVRLALHAEWRLAAAVHPARRTTAFQRDKKDLPGGGVASGNHLE
jgi:hypothetical protein